ncbi:hypothetical protein [Candidatus Chloroploca sp. Khr17]|uniref:hypothetical protein n=1 Tax=Candidatus Chloroploca sp. Khr17 TaxID=2496869 RepID=UPI00196A899E|nr:hypothetical protein [Candidatus Chloroploca sp. Khr17]
MKPQEPTPPQQEASADLPRHRAPAEQPRREVTAHLSSDYGVVESRVRQILTDLEQVREALLALSDDIWLNIDHNDLQALEEGVAFKRTYNERMAEFNLHASELSSLIQQFTHVLVETPMPAEKGRNDAAENERIIRELDRETPHALDEQFSYKRPYGFVLQGHAYKDIVTWQSVYKLVCLLLAKLDPEHFRQLPDTETFITRRGNRDFSRNPKELRMPLALVHGIYAESNYSANEIAKRIGRLLDTFGIERHEFVIYLRQDRDAGLE